MTGMTPLPVLIIGGYLGAGKTTLINHVLRHAGGRRVAVLVNDFGEINIDADLIEGAAAGVISLAGGCLCCSFGDDLVGTLQAFSQGDTRPDVVLIELSGVALPTPVVRSIGLARGTQVVATLVLADASQIPRQASDRYVGETVRQQLREADWILLNKADLATPAEVSALPDWIANEAPQARLMHCSAHEIDPDLLLGWRSPAPDSRGAVTQLANRPIGAQWRSAASVFASRSFTLPTGIDLSALGRALANPGSGVLRAKALAPDPQGQGCCLQVSGARWQIDPAPLSGAGRLVVIGLRQLLGADPLFFERLGLS
jgi:G3E family GTPase